MEEEEVLNVFACPCFVVGGVVGVVHFKPREYRHKNGLLHHHTPNNTNMSN
jgi:hypothetical protein